MEFRRVLLRSPGCSDRTIRRRLHAWASKGVTKHVLHAALSGYEQMRGLDLDDLEVDGSITKSPCGGDFSRRFPVDRGKRGTKRSVAPTEERWVGKECVRSGRLRGEPVH